MSYSTWTGITFLVCLCVVASESVTQHASETGNQTSFSSIVLLHHAKITLQMENSIKVSFEYVFECGPKSKFVITAESGDTSVFAIYGNTTYFRDCSFSQSLDKINETKHEVLSGMEATNLTSRHSLVAHEHSSGQFISGTFELSIHGHFFGISDIVFRRQDTLDDSTEYKEDQTTNHSFGSVMQTTFPVVVLRQVRPVDIIFKNLIIIFIILVTTIFGCKLDLAVVKDCLRRPVAPAIGLTCQYITMPLLGFAISKLLPIDDEVVSFGIFLCGICPGGGASNMFTYLLDGDVDLSITMTFISTVASMGFIPFWLFTLGRVYLDKMPHVEVPFTGMLVIISVTVIPLVAGVFIQYKWSRFAKKLVKILKPISVIGIIITITVALISNWAIFKLLRPVLVLGGSLLPFCGYAIGGTVATIFRQPLPRIKAIAIETGLQNVGVAFLLLISSFPVPMSDLASVAPIAAGIMTPLPVFAVTIPYLIYKRCTRSTEGESEDSEKKSTHEDPVEKEPNDNNPSKVALLGEKTELTSV